MHANHAASRSPRPPADIPVRSGAAAPGFAQVLGAAPNSRGTASGPGNSSVGFPQGASPNWGGFQLDPQNWTANRFLRTENAVLNSRRCPPTRPARSLTATTPSWGTPSRRVWTTLFGNPLSHSGMLLPVDFATDDGMLGVMDRVDT
jgi:hypothetical protein